MPKWEGGKRNKRLKSQRFISPDFKAAVTAWQDGGIGGSLTNYCDSLDAMHEAEGTLNETQQNTYRYGLMEACHAQGCFDYHATAEQRAIAFVLTHDAKMPWE